MLDAIQISGRREVLSFQPSDSASDTLLADVFATAGVRMVYGPNAEIYAEEDSADYVYQVVSGVVRSCKLLSDGRRQIGAFHLPGDVFGFEPGESHSFCAESLGRCTLRAIKRAALVATSRQDAAIANELWAVAANDLKRAQSQMLLLGRKCASERIETFLSEMAERLGSDEIIDLPMSRQDIADYLGLTIETVSRTFSQLEASGAITLQTARRVHLHSKRHLAA
ncbi:helix-turn-helix domain-containing protein [Consotaella salsifontis]|uniref:CRP/FNR family transcriptional regulator, nitrogen fixation regulation protein n=1 Tax=Consotaella salsifontis TaxID=1365950 RepID=A0A1T4R7Y6_9HYPH|nr:helix-turn-helix domain-containing protein [Consotaella salsifontis]SKA12124.1 CRP/FNR family transcriptional regulator, nitrogen fixation regulation protein [Consotaella salsifontis]